MDNFKIENLFSLDECNAKELLKSYTYPWEILPYIKEYILSFISKMDFTDYTVIGDNVIVHNSVKVSPLAVIEGPTIIGINTEIRPFAYIRGNVIIGDNCIVGNSTEIKNAVLFNNVQVPHFNYVGDSVLGFKSHLGAGTKISNFKSDGSNVSVKYDSQVIETYLRKFGAILGDNVEVGCNAVLNPGTIIGKNSNIYPLSSVRGYIGENMIYKNENNIIRKR